MRHEGAGEEEGLPFDDDAGEEDQVAVSGQEGFHSVVLTRLCLIATAWR